MKNWVVSKISSIGISGFTNQIGILIGAIIRARYEHKRFIIIDNFNKQYDRYEPCPISDVIDIPYLNSYLEAFNLIVLDINDISIDISSVIYGTQYHNIDITDEIKEKHMSYGYLYIPKDIPLNNIGGDPKFGDNKYLFIKYTINGHEDCDIYDEHRDEDISYRIISDNKHGQWMSKYDIGLYDDILRNIKFIPKYYEIAHNFTKSLSGKVNAIHVRDEDDAISFWSKINNMSPANFKDKLYEKYIYLIDEYFDKNIPVIVLTGNNNSSTIKYLEKSGYDCFIYDDKIPNQREINALVDLLIGESCNNVFIGNINPENFHGSTFCYLLWKRLGDDVSKLLIDLDDITHDVYQR